MSRFSLFHMFYYYSEGEKMCFVMPKTSLYKGSLNLAGLTVLEIYMSLATLY